MKIASFAAGRRYRTSAALIWMACAAMSVGVVVGCEGKQAASIKPDPADKSEQELLEDQERNAVIATTPEQKLSVAPTTKQPALPSFESAASLYNERVKDMGRVFARANIKLSYYDEQGELKTEEPEGRLQIVRPSKLAMSLGKAGQTLFWFGCNDEQYWWFDLTDKSNRILAYGLHEKYTEQIGKRIGLAIRPLDLIHVLGIEPIDPASRGATQWSKGGEWLGLTSAIGTRGYQRVWVDPKTYMPLSIELWDAQRRPILEAKHTGEEPFELASGRYRPPITSRVTVNHFDSKTTVQLTLTGAKDTGVSERAFALPALMEVYPVDRQIDLDAPRPASAPATAAPNALPGSATPKPQSPAR